MVRLLITVLELLAAVVALTAVLIDLHSRLYDHRQTPRIEQPARNENSPRADGTKPAGTTIAVEGSQQPGAGTLPAVQVSLTSAEDDSQSGTVFTFDELEHTRASDRITVEAEDDSH
jgi:hypothetical protein